MMFQKSGGGAMNKKQRRERSHQIRTINGLSRLNTQQRYHSFQTHTELWKSERQLVFARRENRDWLIDLLPAGLRWIARWRLMKRGIHPELLHETSLVQVSAES